MQKLERTFALYNKLKLESWELGTKYLFKYLNAFKIYSYFSLLLRY